MSKSKYKQGKQIYSVFDFEKSDCTYFKVKFGNRIQTKHRGFLISWQYRTLKQFIDGGRVFEAERMDVDAEVDGTNKSD